MRAMNNTSRSFLVGRDEELRTLNEAFRSPRGSWTSSSTATAGSTTG